MCDDNHAINQIKFCATQLVRIMNMHFIYHLLDQIMHIAILMPISGIVYAYCISCAIDWIKSCI